MNTKSILVVSLILNVGLLGAVGWLVKKNSNHAADSSAVPATTTTVATPAVQPPTPAAPEPAQAAIESAKSEKQIDWRMVESEDYKKYIANLRAIGCPEETIRDIITADVNKLFESRRRAMTSTNKFQYWKTGNMFAGILNEEKIAQNQELTKEKRALLKELLGVEPEEKPDIYGGVNPYEGMLDFLSSDKQSQVTELMTKYQAKALKSLANGTPDAEDMKQVQKVQKEMDDELAKILSPQELEDYQLRMSQTATVMRMQLASFDPSEQEFQKIFDVRKKFDDEFGLMGAATQDKAEKDKYNAAKKEMDDQLKGILGDTRFADYDRAQDWAYQSIYKVAEKNSLPKEAAVQVYDMKKAAEDQAKILRGDKTLTADQRKAALQGVRTETENSIRTVFGDRAWESYKKQPTAYWLRGISPDPKTE